MCRYLSASARLIGTDMPNRIIREGILTSERVAALDWPAEVFYRRLHSIVDDYGRHEAGQQLLRAKCYPLQTDSVRVADIARWMAACQKSGLVLVYGVNGKQYLEVCDFKQQQRTASKCPDPPALDGDCESLLAIDSKCEQVPTNAHLGVVVSVSEGVVDSPRKRGKQPKVSMPEGFGISARVQAWATEKGHTRLPERLEHFIGKCRANGYTYADWDEGFMGAIRDDWAKFPAGATATSAVQSGKPKGPSESPLERDVAYARQQCTYGVIDAAERDRLIAAATEKHRSLQ